MNTMNLPLRLLFCVFLAFGLNTPGRGQPVPPVQQPGNIPPPIGKPHHIVGQVQKGTCAALKGATVQVVEFWYSRAENSNLIIPDGALSFNNRPLEQGRVLGQVVLAGDATAFDVEWLETNPASRVPWAKNVQNGKTGEIITVYRLLSLKVILNAPSVFITIDPIPFVMFSGTETQKSVGTIRVNCTPFG